MPVYSFTVTESEAGHRLDTVLVSHSPTTLSRSRASRLIRAGHVTVNGFIKKPGYLSKPGDIVQSEFFSPEPITCRAEAIDLSILYKDGDVIVLNKPPGLVVHPGAGHHSRTLVNALLFHFPDLEGVGGDLRSGLVHRLDKDTSGTLIVARNQMAHEILCQQFKNRQVRKRYLALVYGVMKASAGVIDLPIGRHSTDRKKMSTQSRRSRSTETRWKIRERFSGVTFLEIDLKTGRTHQIRVHCAAIGHAVVGDAKYGGKRRWKELPSQGLRNILKSVKRQMLHAWQLTFLHPRTEELMSFESPLPTDMACVLDDLRTIP